MQEATSKNIIPQELIENKIYLIRGRKVMLDKDLAILYEVKTEQLKRQVKRNIDRFPEDFMFTLTREEFNSLTCQNGISKGRGGTRHLPYAFTENGVAMLSGILKSDRAVKVNIQIMRTFTKLKQMIITHKDLQLAIERIENRLDKHEGALAEHAQAITELIKQVFEPPEEKPKKQIGFHSK